MDPIARLPLRLAMLLRKPPRRRHAIAMLVALVAALAIGAADRVFGLWPQEKTPRHGPLFRWHGP
jgi:hypothetical protein